jgi:hypothetical protein
MKKKQCSNGNVKFTGWVGQQRDQLRKESIDQEMQ